MARATPHGATPTGLGSRSGAGRAARRPPDLRPDIQASWRRCRASGLAPETRLDSLGFDLEFDRESRLIRAARPVVDHLVETLSGTATCLILTDPRARILDRWTGEHSLQGMLDKVSAAPGAHYDETAAGTNGLGTAVEDRRVAQVFGPDHFVEALRAFSCIGVPIRHPVTGRFEGVLDITCRYQDTNALLLPTILDAASTVEQRLLEQVSRRERTLLEHFLRAKTGSSRAVVCLNEDTIMANAAAAALLCPADQALLWERAMAALRSTNTAVLDVDLGSGGEVPVVMRCQGLHDDDGIVGVLIELDRHRSAGRPAGVLLPDPLRHRDLVGRSDAHRIVCAEVLDHAGHRLPLLVAGEPGAGKSTVARAVHRCDPDGGRLRLLDAGLCAAHGPKAWLAAASRALGNPGGTVLVRHLELLDRTTLRAFFALADTLRPDETAPRLIATLNDDEPSDGLARILPAMFPARIRVPPLRERPEDIADLVPAFLARHAGDGVEVRAAPEVLGVLMRLEWPGNVRELESLIAGMVRRRRRGDLCLADLPASYLQASTRRGLSRMEQLERDAIAAALGATGSKSDAAAALGISRSTLYRKMRTYGMDLEGMAGAWS